MKKYQEALECYNKAHELNLQSSDYLTLKEKCLKQLMESDDAIKCFGEAYEKKNYDSALSAIDRAIENEPFNLSYLTLRKNILEHIFEKNFDLGFLFNQ